MTGDTSTDIALIVTGVGLLFLFYTITSEKRAELYLVLGTTAFAVGVTLLYRALTSR
jgi:hypothetical protein